MSSVDCCGETLPLWILSWFYTSAIVCTWDATFIMLRPLSFPSGQLAWLFYPYKWYIELDQRYKDTNDDYVFAQSLMNYAEVLINVLCIYMHHRCSRHTRLTSLVVSIMTWWKTVLYILMLSEFCTGGVYRQGNSLLLEFFLVFIPNFIWIVVPLAAIVYLWVDTFKRIYTKPLTDVNGNIEPDSVSEDKTMQLYMLTNKLTTREQNIVNRKHGESLTN